MHVDDFIEELWTYANSFPMREHPWFRGIAEHKWTREQIIAGEVQHYLRVRENPGLLRLHRGARGRRAPPRPHRGRAGELHGGALRRAHSC